MQSRCVAQITALPSPHTQHYPDLDVLRGVAACVVVLFHLSVRIQTPWLFPHGFLAVDLFFVLSGFVLAHAYGDVLQRGMLTPWRFVLIRIVRLWPMVLLGALVGFLPLLAKMWHEGIVERWRVVACFVRGSFLIPTLGDLEFGPTIFPVNGPFWSLFFEFIANILFALMWYRAARRLSLVAPMAIFCGIVLAVYIFHAGTLQSAGVNFDSYLYGLPRVVFSFCIGLALFYFRLTLAFLPRGRGLACGLFLVLSFMPTLPPVYEQIYQIITFAIILPLIVVMAITGRPVESEDFFTKWAGLVSYPLYAVHYAFVRVLGNALQDHIESESGRVFCAILILAILVVAAAVIERVIDQPMRRILRAMVLKKPTDRVARLKKMSVP